MKGKKRFFKLKLKPGFPLWNNREIPALGIMVAPINHEGKIFIHASQFSWGKLKAKKVFFWVEGGDQNIMVEI